MKKKLIIFPFNGNGIEAFDCLGDNFEFIGFADDTSEKQKKYENFEVFSRDLIERHPEAKVLAVPGSPLSYNHRRGLINSLGLTPSRWARVIHPRASVANVSNIGFNTLLMAGVVITSTAKLGNHVCVLPNSVVHHDTLIGDYTLIGSNVTVAGYVKVGANCYVGSGSNIINGITIGAGALIGLGSNVIGSVEENSRVAGNPAKSR